VRPRGAQSKTASNPQLRPRSFSDKLINVAWLRSHTRWGRASTWTAETLVQRCGASGGGWDDHCTRIKEQLHDQRATFSMAARSPDGDRPDDRSVSVIVVSGYGRSRGTKRGIMRKPALSRRSCARSLRQRSRTIGGR
jgi:hypothetical protein